MVHFKIGYNVYFCAVQLHGSILISIVLCLCSSLVSGATLGGQGGDECACPGDSLMYTCTVQGTIHGSTVWNGTAFSGCPQDEILLSHPLYNHTEGTAGTCNNGDIEGQSLGVQGNHYTSQLNVTVTPDIVGKTITCVYDALTADHSNDMTLFTATIPGQFSPPNTLHTSAVNFVSNELTFTWSPVAPDCPSVHYNILTSNCGSCPTTTNHTNVTCTDVPKNGTTCTFAVQTVNCRYITGNASDPISITLYSQTPTTDYLHVYPTENLTTQRSDTAAQPAGTHTLNSNSAVYVISIGSLATGLIASAVLFTTVTAIILRRSKVKTNAALELSQRGGNGTTHGDPVYEEVAGTSLHSLISTQDNVAYRHTKNVNTERITTLMTVP